MLAGSRARWIAAGKETDNYGFAAFVQENKEEFRKLGIGTHYGEWWGQGIQRTYDLTERRFWLFNTFRHLDAGLPAIPGIGIVPVLFDGKMEDTAGQQWAVNELRLGGSKARPGYMKPEGVVVYYVGLKVRHKVIFDSNTPKGQREEL